LDASKGAEKWSRQRSRRRSKEACTTPPQFPTEANMELFRQTNIDFLKYKWWAIGASWALILVGLFTIFIQKGLKFGIDFAGGTAIAVRFGERPDIDHLRRLLDGANLGEIGIQRYE